MLHTIGFGKILSKLYQELRLRGIENRDHLTDEQWTFCGLEFPHGAGKDKEKTYLIKSRIGNEIDIRERSECNG